MSKAPVYEVVRGYVLREWLRSEDDRDALEDDTELLSSGVVSSLALVRMVAFLEREFAVTIAPHEMNAKHMDTVAKIVGLVEARLR
jgi:acyl carrier protein